ncbi:hypothetical protein FA15DRAFT_97604 [Coprinopsis marcescibilis]|uniref:Uncharacterized protein n=1 Tax=Coprinopsis marcescibilis TaxID=230819 RepID=A0A5C3KMF3_COPMA|nr:hypothetical protein FA15DRAFT_97604 [Coprinopsis marcescibilis]
MYCHSIVPHDQWLLTHIAPYYKIKDVKHHILAKCLNLTFTPPEPPLVYTSQEGGAQRPPSPITFAPDPRERPISPILFANIRKPQSDEDDSDDFEEDESAVIKPTRPRFDDDTTSYNGSISTTANTIPEGGRVLPSSSSKTSSSSRLQPFDAGSRIQHKGSNVNMHIDSKLVPELAHLSFALVAYSSGQILEDEYPLSDYDIDPHALLELHLSISPPSPNHPTAVGFKPPTREFPFPILHATPQLLKTKSKRKKRAQLQALVAPHSTRLVSLPRGVPTAYAQPYWEGWVRILRFACRDDVDYMYGGARSRPKGGPGYAQFGGVDGGNWGHAGNVMLGGDPPERDKMMDNELALNFGFYNMAGGRRDGGEPRSGFEWRERWLVIRDGWIFFLKERGDTEPSHYFPLGHLVTLRDADQLTESIGNSKQRRSMQRRTPSRRREAAGSAAATTTTNRVQVAEVPPDGPPASPTATIKGGSSTPLQSGYGHGRHNFGKTPTAHASTSTARARPYVEDDAYDEDDEGEVPKLSSTSTQRQRTTSQQHKPTYISHQHHHHHHHQHQPQHQQRPQPRGQQPSTPGGSARRKDDPMLRYRMDPRTFVPNSKEEAEMVGMRIVCAKFMQPTSEEKAGAPDPVSGVEDAREPKEVGKYGRELCGYTNTGPTLADVSAGITLNAALLNAALVDVDWDREREKEKEKEREKEREREREKEKAEEKMVGSREERTGGGRYKTGLMVGNQTMHGQVPSTSSNADRRPSLPTLGNKLSGSNLVNPPPSSYRGDVAVQAGSSSSGFSFSSVFGSSEEKRKRKEAKKAEKERMDMEKQEAEVGMSSSNSWRIGRMKKSSTNTVGTKEGSDNSRGPSTPIHEISQAASMNMARSLATGPVTDSSASLYQRYTGSVAPSKHVDSDVSSVFSGRDNGEGGVFSDSEHGHGSVRSVDRHQKRHNGLAVRSETTVSSSSRMPAQISVPSVQVSDGGEGEGEGEGEDGSESGSDSLALSSPVFARESEGDTDSDSELHSGRRRRRYLYPRDNTLNTLVERDATSISERLEEGEKVSWKGKEKARNPTRLEEETIRPQVLEVPKSMGRGEQPVSPAASTHKARTPSINTSSTVRPNRKPGAGGKRQEPQKGQWIIMDLMSDAAYFSLLRVLHRAFGEPLTSSFMRSLPTLGALVASPTSVEPRTGSSPLKRSNSLVGGADLLSSPTTPNRARSRSDAGALFGPRSGAQGDSSPLPGNASPVHPAKLGTLVRTHLSKPSLNIGPRALGALPFPEWRVDAVQRARRAGLGLVSRPLEMMLMQLGEQRDEDYVLDDPLLCFVAKAKLVEEERRVKEFEKSRRRRRRFGSVDGDDDGESSSVGDEEEERDDDDEGLLLTGSDDEEGDESEMEWQAWTADIPRQVKVGKEKEAEKNEEEDAEPPSPATDDESVVEPLPTTLAKETELALKRARNMEPCGVITSKYTSTAIPGFVVEGNSTAHHEPEAHKRYHLVFRKNTRAPILKRVTISSRSSMESLSARSHSHSRRYGSLGGQTSGQSSQATTPPLSSSYHGHSHSVSSSYSSRHLHHSVSMQTNLRMASESSGEHYPMRMPSMPSLGSTTSAVTEQSFLLTHSSFGTAIRELTVQDDSPVSQHDAPSNTSLASVSQLSTSVGRPIRGGILRRNESVSDWERGSPPGEGSVRPKLTLATGSGSEDMATSVASSSKSPGRGGPRKLLRRVKSGSSFRSDEALPNPPPVQTPTRRKKSGVFERIVKGFDNALS